MAVTPIQPDALSNLELWLDINSLSALANNDPVSTWADTSGNSRDFTQASSTLRPLYKTNISPKGKAAVWFDNIDDQMDGGGVASDWTFLHNGSAYTVVVVFRVDTTVSATTIILDNSSRNTLNEGQLHYMTSTNQLTRIMRGDGTEKLWTAAGNNSFTLLNTHYWITTFENNVATNGQIYWLDGSAILQAGTDGITWDTDDSGHNLKLGARSGVSNTSPYKDYIFEIIIYSQKLSDANRQGLESYLKQKYLTDIPADNLKSTFLVKNPRIRYGGKIVDFDRPFVSLNRADEVDSHVNQSIKGNEVLILAERKTLKGKLSFQNPEIANDRMRHFFQHAKNGSTFDLWVNRAQGPYWGFESQTLINNNFQTGTTARASTGYYQDFHTGDLKTKAANLPRFEAGKFGAGLLNEKASVNWITNNQFTPWTPSSASFDKIGYVNDPTNSTTLAQLVEITDNQGGFIFTTNRLVSLATKGCFSMYARAYDKTLRAELLLQHDTGSPAFQTALMELTCDWQRFYVATLNHAYTAAGAKWRCDFNLYGATGDKAIFAFPQFEETSYPTSYMLTEGATFARAKESHSFPITADDDIDVCKGTLLFWVKPLFQYADDDVHVLLIIEDSSGRDFLEIWKDGSGNLRVTMAAADNVDVVDLTIDPSSFLTAGSWTRLAVTWDLTVDDAVNVYANGTAVATSFTEPFSPVQSPSIVRIAVSTDSGSFVIDELEILKYAMTAGEVSSDASMSRGRGIGHNHYKNMQLISSAWNPVLRPGRAYYEFDLDIIEYNP